MKQWNVYAFADEASSMIDGQIKAMKRNALKGVEIRTVDGEGISSISLQKAREVRSRLDQAELKVFSIGSPIGKIGINDPFEPHLELLKHTIEIAHVLGTKQIRMFSFYLPQNEEASLYRNAVMDRMGKMLDAAETNDAILCHENEKGIYGDIAVRCKELHDVFPALHGIFDPANFIQCGQDTWEAWQMLHPYIDYMHVKDALKDGTVVPAGRGIGRLPELLAAFEAQGGCSLTVEPHLAVFDGLKALEREGEETKINPYTYETNDQAFDAACAALWTLL